MKYMQVAKQLKWLVKDSQERYKKYRRLEDHTRLQELRAIALNLGKLLSGRNELKFIKACGFDLDLER